MKQRMWRWVWMLCAAWMLALPERGQGQDALLFKQTSVELPIRLQTRVSTVASRTDDPVKALVIAGPWAGAKVSGTVETATASRQPDQRAILALHFTALDAGAVRASISARVAAVDNARETVDGEGHILGILAAETITGQMDNGLGRLGDAYSGLADLLSAAKAAALQPASTEIDFAPGVEMALRLESPIPALPHKPVPNGVPGPTVIQERAAKEPFRTIASKPRKPSDLTNVMLIGEEDSVRKAFAEAGWKVAASLTPDSRIQTLVALAEGRGYAEAPVSLLKLGGRPPDMVFEKTTDTFARRHHVRIWRRPSRLLGLPVWAGAATHDISIDFSETDRTFIHRIDFRIDREREKIVDDLVLTGEVKGVTPVARPKVPRRARNATGDAMETDGGIAVLLLR